MRCGNRWPCGSWRGRPSRWRVRAPRTRVLPGMKRRRDPHPRFADRPASPRTHLMAAHPREPASSPCSGLPRSMSSPPFPHFRSCSSNVALYKPPPPTRWRGPGRTLVRPMTEAANSFVRNGFGRAAGRAGRLAPFMRLSVTQLRGAGVRTEPDLCFAADRASQSPCNDDQRRVALWPRGPTVRPTTVLGIVGSLWHAGRGHWAIGVRRRTTHEASHPGRDFSGRGPVPDRNPAAGHPGVCLHQTRAGLGRSFPRSAWRRPRIPTVVTPGSSRVWRCRLRLLSVWI